MKIDEIENAVTNKKSAIAWNAINEISGRKQSNRARLKAKNDKERIMLWHSHFKELLGKKITSTRHINLDENEQDLDIKRGLFTSDELLKATKRIQHGKAVGLDEIPAEIWKIPTRNNSKMTNRSTSGQILMIRRSLEGVNSHNIPAVLLFVDYSKAFDSIDRKNMKHILKSY